jgi:ABC-2 type transport system permease protein
MRPYLNLVRAHLRSFFRERQQVFWSFFFPLFFMLLFGTIFGRSNDDNSKIRFDVGLVAPANIPPQFAWAPEVFRSKVGVLKVKEAGLDALTADLKAGNLRAIIVFPNDFSQRAASQQASDIRILTDASQPQMSSAVSGIIQTVLDKVNGGLAAAATGQPPPPVMVRARTESVSPGAETGKPRHGIDYLLPGILAMTVMQLGLFTAVALVVMREKGLLRRLRATPLPRMTIVLSQVTNRLIIGLIQAMVLVLIGVAVFHFQMSGSWPLVLAFIVYGVLTFVSIGAVLASVAKTQETAMSMVQMVNLPMMFLSGMFIPLELLPESLRSVVNVLPATHLATMLRHLMVGMPAHPAADLGVMAAWMAVSLVIAARTFRWE